MNIALEHASKFVLKAQETAVKRPKKINVIYIADEYKFVNSDDNQRLNKLDEVDGVKLYYLPF